MNRIFIGLAVAANIAVIAVIFVVSKPPAITVWSPTCDFVERSSREAELARIKSLDDRCTTIYLKMLIDGVQYRDTEAWRLTVKQYEDDYDTQRKGGLFDFDKAKP